MLRGRFPRTPHVVNGPLKGAAVTRDDLTLTEDEADLFIYRDMHPAGAALQLVVEEKLDGANLGISLASDGGTLQAQNRSHYVNGATASQWAGLPRFLADTREELLALFYALPDSPEAQRAIAAGASSTATVSLRLGQPPVATDAEETAAHPSNPACDWIVFGEWLAAQHSVFYDALPSPFVVFDIYHVPSQRFLAADLRDALVGQHCPSLPTSHRVAAWPLTALRPRQQQRGSAKAGGRRESPPPPPTTTASPQPRAVLDAWDAIHELWHRRRSHFFADDGGGSTAGAGAVGRASTSNALPRMMEGVVMRLEDTAAGFQLARCKAVHDEFIAAVEDGGHWRKQALVKNIIVGTPMDS